MDTKEITAIYITLLSEDTARIMFNGQVSADQAEQIKKNDWLAWRKVKPSEKAAKRKWMLYVTEIQKHWIEFQKLFLRDTYTVFYKEGIETLSYDLLDHLLLLPLEEVKRKDVNHDLCESL